MCQFIIYNNVEDWENYNKNPIEMYPLLKILLFISVYRGLVKL